MSDFKLTILCPDCGSRDLQLPEEVFPDSVVTCNNCGKELIYGEVLESTNKKIFQALQNHFGKEQIERGISDKEQIFQVIQNLYGEDLVEKETSNNLNRNTIGTIKLSAPENEKHEGGESRDSDTSQYEDFVVPEEEELESKEDSKEELLENESPGALKSELADTAFESPELEEEKTSSEPYIPPSSPNELSPFSGENIYESEQDSKEETNWFTLTEEQKLKLMKFFEITMIALVYLFYIVRGIVILFTVIVSILIIFCKVNSKNPNK